MDVKSIIKESLYYPFSNLFNWLTIALIFLLIGILEEYIITTTGITINLASIFLIIVSIITLGLAVSIIRGTVYGVNSIQLDFLKNIREGIEATIITLIYLIIPGILTLFIAYPAGLYSNFYKLVLASSHATSITNIAFTSIENFLISSVITVSFAIILYIFNILLLDMALARLADTGDLFEAFNINNIIKSITKIGWDRYLSYTILILIITFILSMISVTVTFIPFIGRVIASLIIDSYTLLFISHATGLIYIEGY